MSAKTSRGEVFRCPLCGAEVAVLAFKSGDFHPRCCNVDMELLPKVKLSFYFCPECAAEVALVRGDAAPFDPHCCNRPMIRYPSA